MWNFYFLLASNPCVGITGSDLRVSTGSISVNSSECCCALKKKPFLHVWVFHLHVCLYNTCMLGALKSGVGVNPLELELQMTLSWESNLSSLREPSVLWTTELSFQPVLCCSFESVLYLSIGLFGYLSSTFSCSLLHESFPSCFDLFCNQLRCECRTWVSVSSYYRTRFSIHFFFPFSSHTLSCSVIFSGHFFEKYKSIRFPLKFWQLVIAIAFDQGPNIEWSGEEKEKSVGFFFPPHLRLQRFPFLAFI